MQVVRRVRKEQRESKVGKDGSYWKTRKSVFRRSSSTLTGTAARNVTNQMRGGSPNVSSVTESVSLGQSALLGFTTGRLWCAGMGADIGSFLYIFTKINREFLFGKM